MMKLKIISQSFGVMRFGWIFFICLISMLYTAPTAAGEWTVSGTVFEKETKRPLQGALVSVQDNTSLSSVSIAPPKSLPEVVVRAERSPEQVSKNVISGKELRQLAGSSGDPLRALQSLPGVATVDGSSAPAVRGSGPGDNLYYVDGLRIGKLFHYGGISVFNADLIEDFNLYSAAFSPHYGDVTGAVIDVALREPRKDRLGGKVNVSLMGADFLVEGPRNNDQSFYFAARRSYDDLFIKQIEQKGVTLQIPNYWDYQGKYLWRLNDANRLTFHLYGAADILKLNISSNAKVAQQEPVSAGDSAFSNTNTTQAVVLDTSLSDSAYNKLVFEHSNNRTANVLGMAGNINQTDNNLLLSDQVNMELNAGHELSLGTEFINAVSKVNVDFKNAPCTQFNPNCDLTSASRQQLTDTFTTNVWSVSAQDRKRVSSQLTLIGGVRYSKENYANKTYTEPRLGMEWEWSERTMYTAGWGRHNQYPTGEQWSPKFGNPKLDHIRAEHSVLGVRHKVDADWNWKAETYYKKFSNLVINDALLNYSNAASGKAYGVELLIKKEPTGKFSGWWVLNLAKSQRRNDVTGEAFRFEYDQPINTTLVANYKASEEWSFGMKWNYHSGTPYTPITGTSGTYPDGRPIPVYAGVNSGTLPVYHRLDLRADRNYVFKTWKLNTYFELNNWYGRKNIVGYTYDATYTTKEPVYSFVLPISFGVQAEF